jgi:hypothetical protein
MLSSNEAAEAAKPEPQKQVTYRVSRITEGSDCYRAFLTTPADGGPRRYAVETNGCEIWGRVDTHGVTRNTHGEPLPNPIGQAAVNIAETLAASADLKYLADKLDALKFDLFAMCPDFKADAEKLRDAALLLMGIVADAERAVQIAKVRQAYEEEEQRSAEARALFEKQKAEAVAAEEERKRREAEEYEASRPPAIC